jgi:hypothetical protein
VGSASTAFNIQVEGYNAKDPVPVSGLAADTTARWVTEHRAIASGEWATHPPPHPWQYPVSMWIPTLSLQPAACNLQPVACSLQPAARRSLAHGEC